MRIAAGLALLVSLVVNFGLVDLVTAVAPSPEWEPAGLPGDDTNGFEHWTVQSALPIALVLLVALSAFRTEGWRVPAASAAIGAATLGALGIATDAGLGDFTTGWGIAAIAWSALVALAATTRWASTPAPDAPSERSPVTVLSSRSPAAGPAVDLRTPRRSSDR